MPRPACCPLPLFQVPLPPTQRVGRGSHPPWDASPRPSVCSPTPLRPPPRHPLHPPALRDQPLTYTHAHRRAPPSPVSPGPPHRCPSAPLPPLRSSLSPSARSPHCPPAPPAVRPPPPHPARPPRQPGHPLHIRRPSTPARPGPTRVSSSKPLPSSAVSARGPCPRTYFHPKSIHPTTQRPTSRLFSSPNPPSFSAHGWAAAQARPSLWGTDRERSQHLLLRSPRGPVREASAALLEGAIPP